MIRLRGLEAMLSFHILHDISELPTIVDIQALNLGVHGRPFRLTIHQLLPWFRRDERGCISRTRSQNRKCHRSVHRTS